MGCSSSKAVEITSNVEKKPIKEESKSEDKPKENKVLPTRE